LLRDDFALLLVTPFPVGRDDGTAEKFPPPPVVWFGKFGG